MHIFYFPLALSLAREGGVLPPPYPRMNWTFGNTACRTRVRSLSISNHPKHTPVRHASFFEDPYSAMAGDWALILPTGTTTSSPTCVVVLRRRVFSASDKIKKNTKRLQENERNARMYYSCGTLCPLRHRRKFVYLGECKIVNDPYIH